MRIPRFATIAQVLRGTSKSTIVTPEGLATYALKQPGSSSSPSLAFDTWRTPNADRPTLVSVALRVECGSATSGTVDFNVDESGGASSDYNYRVDILDLDGQSVRLRSNITALIPPGASYEIENAFDPNSNNSIDDLREFTL